MAYGGRTDIERVEIGEEWERALRENQREMRNPRKIGEIPVTDGDGKPLGTINHYDRAGIEYGFNRYDATTIDTNERGGKQSAIGVRLDLLPADAVKAVGKRLALGADRYAKNNWRLISTEDHLNHALRHILNALAVKDDIYNKLERAGGGLDVEGDADLETPYHELSAAACRLLMALEVYINGQWEEL